LLGIRECTEKAAALVLPVFENLHGNITTICNGLVISKERRKQGLNKLLSQYIVAFYTHL